MPAAPLEMQGGAVVTKVAIQPVTGPEPEGETVEVITTAPGTMGLLGIVPVGTRAKIAPEAFSKHWMRPATRTAAKKLGIE